MTYQIVKKLHTLSNELVGMDDDIGDQFVVPNEAAAIIEELAAVLKPFAELADWFERNLSSEELVFMNYYPASCRARETLRKLKGE